MTEEQRTENRRQKTEDGKQNSEYRISNVECRALEEEQTELLGQEQDIETTVETVVEAVLFASDEPLSEARLANIVETSVKQVRQCVKRLNDKYQANSNAFRIEQIAGGYQMLTLSPYNYWLKKLLRARSDSKLSPAAVETLAIIAYKQPVMRADIEVVRGVAAGEVIRTLCYKGLVKIVGRAEVLGRPMLYGTTKKFLEVFGLNTLKDLPKIEELKKPPS
jgi:segregation and condensation protein B